MKKSEYAEGLRIYSGDAPGFKGTTIGPLWLVGNQYYCRVAFEHQSGVERDRAISTLKIAANQISEVA
ncbi:MAG: hypothetical protein ACRCZF_14830 [Gemmataceae bacterium]